MVFGPPRHIDHIKEKRRLLKGFRPRLVKDPHLVGVSSD